MRRILVLRAGALGDLIVTLPALALLRGRWPAARIELVGNTVAGQLALAAKLVDQVHSQHEARWAALYADAPLPLPKLFAEFLAMFDLVLNFWPDPDGELQRKFPVTPGQTFLSGAAKPTSGPAAAHYAEPLRPLGLELVQPWFDLSEVGGDLRAPLSDSATQPRPEVAVHLRSPLKVAIHPGSGSPTKNWPIERWRQLARWLNDEDRVELLIVSGEAERDDLLADFGRPLRNRSLLELAGELKGAALFLGHDSGVGHLAAALGLPCVLLFGPTDPAIWAPPTPRVRVLRRGDALSSISVDEVRAAVSAALGDRK
jgi:ADP-heptose:LPS heptosyltransferase